MVDNNENKSIEELEEELKRAKINAEINQLNNGGYSNNNERIKKAKTLKILSIVNLCIIPAVASFGITLLIQFILTIIHPGKSENQGLKIAAAVCTFCFLIIGSIICLIYANKEME